MKVFRIEKLRFAPMYVIADNAHHASHILFHGLINGLHHYPKMQLAIGEWDPSQDSHFDALKEWARCHQPGIAHEIEDGQTWELIETQLDRV